MTAVFVWRTRVLEQKLEAQVDITGAVRRAVIVLACEVENRLAGKVCQREK